MISGFGGKLSSGKTVSAVKECLDQGLKGKRVISNIKLNFPKNINVIYMPNELLIEYIWKNADNDKALMDLFYNSILLIDEITNLFNARKSASDLNDLLTSFIMYIGKMDCDVCYTYQIWESQTDKRLRGITNTLSRCFRGFIRNGKFVPIIFGPRIITNKRVVIGLLSEYDLDLYGIRYPKFWFDPTDIYPLYNTREINLLDRSKYKKKGKLALTR